MQKDPAKLSRFRTLLLQGALALLRHFDLQQSEISISGQHSLKLQFLPACQSQEPVLGKSFCSCPLRLSQSPHSLSRKREIRSEPGEPRCMRNQALRFSIRIRHTRWIPSPSRSCSTQTAASGASHPKRVANAPGVHKSRYRPSTCQLVFFSRWLFFKGHACSAT